MKKLFSLLCMVFMMLALSVPVFAEDEVDTIPPPDLGTQTYPDSTNVDKVQCYVNELGLKICDPQYSAGWDFVTDDLFYLTAGDVGEWNTDIGGIAYSTGGGFRVKIKPQSLQAVAPNTTATLEIQLWEDDGAFGDDPVKTWYLSPHSYDQNLDISNASDYVDGINGKAEFYIKFTGNYSIYNSNAWVYYYD